MPAAGASVRASQFEIAAIWAGVAVEVFGVVERRGDGAEGRGVDLVSVSVPFLTLAAVTASFLIFAVVTGFFFSCLAPTLFFASCVAAKALAPSRQRIRQASPSRWRKSASGASGPPLGSWLRPRPPNGLWPTPTVAPIGRRVNLAAIPAKVRRRLAPPFAPLAQPASRSASTNSRACLPMPGIR